MKTYTEEEVDAMLTAAFQHLPGPVDEDDGSIHKQIVIYTGIFRRSDGTYTDTPE